MILYKYLNTERTDLLKTKNIRFTQPKFLDDVFEGRPNLKRLSTTEAENKFIEDDYLEWKKSELPKILNQTGIDFNENLVTGSEWDLFFKNVYEESKKIIFQVLTSDEKTTIKPLAESIYNAVNKYFGVLCLAQESNNSLMW
ncbi:MAG: hypothetical protein ABL872_03800, partial [Lacibacter sp.]